MKNSTLNNNPKSQLFSDDAQVDEISAKSNISLEVYPNPATEQLTIEYNLPATTLTEVVLVNIYGEYIKILQSPKLKASGKHAISADLIDLSSGVCLVRFNTNEEVITKKIAVVK